jgi:hypothetical protein
MKSAPALIRDGEKKYIGVYVMKLSAKHSWVAMLSLVGTFAFMFVTAVPTAHGEDNDTIRLRAFGRAAINGIEAQLEGDWRRTLSPFRQRLDGELKNIHLPLNTPVAFCLVTSAGTQRLRVSRVHLEAGIKVAELDLDTNNGNVVPNVHAGDRIQTRQARNAPFNSNPTCGSPLLVSATFQ